METRSQHRHIHPSMQRPLSGNHLTNHSIPKSSTIKRIRINHGSESLRRDVDRLLLRRSGHRLRLAYGFGREDGNKYRSRKRLHLNRIHRKRIIHRFGLDFNTTFILSLLVNRATFVFHRVAHDARSWTFAGA